MAYKITESAFLDIANLIGGFLEVLEEFISGLINPYVIILFIFMLAAITYWFMIKPAKTLIKTGGSQ